MLIGIFFIVVLVFLGKDFFGRERPSLIQSDNKGGVLHEDLQLTSKSFPVAFGLFLYSEGRYFIDNSIYTVEAIFSERNSEGFVEKKLDMETCRGEDFS